MQLSVVIVSRERPDALLRAIAGVRQSDHLTLELVVVADPAACAKVAALALPIKIVPFDVPNIGAARNAGIAVAGGQVIAFLDDDAVPEPTWAQRLSAPFANPDVHQAGGFVRGRNGISLQWAAMEVDASGIDHALQVMGTTLMRGSAQRAVKTQGTNCAFRAEILRALGGFDPAYHFYLDEADVNLRMAALGGLTAIVPDAQVHHGFAASGRRRADRVPTTLFDIGASTAVFVRRHGGRDDALVSLLADQRVRALRHMVDGRIMPGDVARLMHTLVNGWNEGQNRLLYPLTPISASDTFVPLGTHPRAGRILAGRNWQLPGLQRKAVTSAATHITTVYAFSPTFRRHRMQFDVRGFWVQQGGLFGRAERDRPLRHWPTFASRVAAEARRISEWRPTSE